MYHPYLLWTREGYDGLDVSPRREGYDGITPICYISMHIYMVLERGMRVGLLCE